MPSVLTTYDEPIPEPAGTLPNLEVFERAFADLELAPTTRTAAGPLARFGRALSNAFELFVDWSEAPCPSCHAHGTVTADPTVGLWTNGVMQHCGVCDYRWPVFSADDSYPCT